MLPGYLKALRNAIKKRHVENIFQGKNNLTVGNRPFTKKRGGGVINIKLPLSLQIYFLYFSRHIKYNLCNHGTI